MTGIRSEPPRTRALPLLLGLLLGLAHAEIEFYRDAEPKFVSQGFDRLARILEAQSYPSDFHYQSQPAHHQKPQHLEQLEQLQQLHQPFHHHQHHQPQHEQLKLEQLHRQQQQQQQQQQQEQLELEQLHRQQQQQEQLELEELHRQQQQQKQQQQEQLELEELHRQQQQRSHQQHLIELARQKQRGILRDDLPERPNIIDALEREAVDPLEYVRELERQRLLPYLEYEPEPRIKPYSVEDEARARLLPSSLSKDPMLDYPETQYVDLERARQLEEARRLEAAFGHRSRPQFTYAFDRPDPELAARPVHFAVGPNDPRYYSEDESFVRESANKGPGVSAEEPDERSREEPAEGSTEQPSTPLPRKQPEPSRRRRPSDSRVGAAEDDLPRTGLVEVSMLPEPQRRADQDPLAVSIKHKVNSDIYFIAVVAGCSAAAMFALVLISLTWCRIQRVSKAAADVEYPAYGVTGPNKDVSPSGDQRLAQSAQMYHFQHQKQQIIAMENRASAARDPGSVSEAESDEENEEGDYTVYECPGLAPTGEMEVKNPMFHDDPTPATPAKSSRRLDDEDDL